MSEEQVRIALNSILASDDFASAERLSRFLRFAVEKTLAGEGAELKEYLLGTEVFDRGTEFDPRLDPIVRVEARRLRSKLQEYYEGRGGQDAVRIVFRKGGYAPSFEPAPAAPSAVAPAPKRSWRWLLAPALALTAVAGVFLYRSVGPSVILSVVVVPSPESDDREFSDGLAESVAAELARNSQLRVVAWPMVIEYRARHAGSPQIGPLARELGAESVLWLDVRRRDDRRRIAAILMLPERGFKEWAGEFERGVSDSFAVQREIARAVADEVNRALPRVRGK